MSDAFPHKATTLIMLRPGLPHAHFAFFPMLKSGKEALIDTFQGLGWLLGKEVTAQEIAGAIPAPSSG